MRINNIMIQGFRAFKDPTEIFFGHFSTIVGKNDTGKSSVLHVLNLFFKDKLDEDDFNNELDTNAPIIIQVSFIDLPTTVQLEEAVDTDLKVENLLDPQGNFTIRKTFTRKAIKKPKIEYIIEDFSDPLYQNLCSLKEAELNERGKSLSIELKKSGAGITNKSKREVIRNTALSNKISKASLAIVPTEAALQVLEYIPDFSLFPADKSLNEEGTEFQKEFKVVVENAVDKIAGKSEIENGVEKEIDNEVAKIHSFLLRHTDEVSSIKARPSFEWKNLVSFYLECKDKQDKEIAFAKRGSGLRRLLMVAYFQYLAQRDKSKELVKSTIYGIEEPETYLHPGAQRELLDSFKTITMAEQVLVSSHSPVFAGSTDVENLVLITRETGIAKVFQRDKLELAKVADELGVEPSDQIHGYKAIVFTDGPDDCDFFNTIVETFHRSGRLAFTLKEKKIGILPGCGSNLKHWVTRKAIKSINHRYAVIMDSDLKSNSDQISPRKIALKLEIESDGGICIILRKREIENYLHPDVVMNKTGKAVTIDDYVDVKSIGISKICNFVEFMTAEQLLERDKYYDKGNEKHELLEICEKLINLTE
jgi:putative ATP-dependent endonuclease of the OLD family